MNMTIILLVLFLQIMSIRPFDCSDIIIEDQCDPSFGCSWDSSQGNCLGTFIPDCTKYYCYYVDPDSQTGVPDGTFTNPFTSLDQALQQANIFGSEVIRNIFASNIDIWIGKLFFF